MPTRTLLALAAALLAITLAALLTYPRLTARDADPAPAAPARGADVRPLKSEPGAAAELESGRKNIVAASGSAALASDPSVPRLTIFGIAGEVRDTTGHAVAGALVTIEPFPSLGRTKPRHAVTDAQGRFEIAGLAPDLEHRLLVEHADHGPREVHGLLPADLREGGPRPVVLLLPAGSVRGQVVDGEGRQVREAAVQVHRNVPGNDELGPLLHEAKTDEAGSFAVTALPREGVDLVVASPGLASALLRGVPTLGFEELRIVLPPAARLQGRVVDERGANVHGATVVAFKQEAANLQRRSRCQSDAGGRFVFELLAPGAYYVTARAEGFIPARLGPAPAGADDLIIRLEPSHRIEGQVRDEFGRPIAGARVRLLRPGSQPHSPEILSDVEVTSDARGAFALESLHHGTFWVQACSADGGLGRSRMVVLEPDQRLAREDVVFAEPALVEARILTSSGAPAVGATIAMLGHDSAGPPFALADMGEPAGEEGWVQLSAVPPGDAHVIVRAPGCGPSVVPVLGLYPGERRVLGDLQLEPTGGVRGRVVSKASMPLEGAEILARRLDPDLSPLRRAHTLSHADGRFELERLPPGRYMLTASRPAAGRLPALVDASRGGELRVVVLPGETIPDVLLTLAPPPP